jgi:hypothetical protein
MCRSGGVLAGCAGLLGLATITPAPKFDAPRQAGWDPNQVVANRLFSINNTLIYLRLIFTVRAMLWWGQHRGNICQ